MDPLINTRRWGRYLKTVEERGCQTTRRGMGFPVKAGEFPFTNVHLWVCSTTKAATLYCVLANHDIIHDIQVHTPSRNVRVEDHEKGRKI